MTDEEIETNIIKLIEYKRRSQYMHYCQMYEKFQYARVEVRLTDKGYTWKRINGAQD